MPLLSKTSFFVWNAEVFVAIGQNRSKIVCSAFNAFVVLPNEEKSHIC